MISELKAEAAAATPAPLATVPATPPPTGPVYSPEGLARALQSELKRVGCDPGSLDGTWGVKSRQALERFARLSTLPIPTGEPTEAALQGVAGQMGRICPLACEPGETEVNGSCVPKKADRRKAAPRPQRQKVEQGTFTPGFRLCVGGRALGLCTH
jgi:hypothetical protein